MRGIAARFALSALLVAAVAGCEDPAKDKTKAVTTEAISTAAAQLGAAPGTTPKESTPQAGVTYAFDQSASKIGWTGSKVTGKHDGTFDAFKGTVRLLEGAPEKGKVEVDIDTASLNTTPAQLVAHLKSDELFDVAKFPKATFSSTEVRKGGDKGASHTITGNLTLHGITKGVSFPANVQIAGDQVTVDAEFSINRKDFGINYPGKPNDLIRDDVVIRLAIHAKKS